MKYELRYVGVGCLVPGESNPQTMNSETFELLKASMADNGCIEALTVVDLEDGRYRIIGGEHRWRAATQLGLDELPALLVPLRDWDQDWQDIITVRLNALKGHLDRQKFLSLYTRLASKYGKEVLQQQLGFSDRRAFEALITDIDRNLKNTGVSAEIREQFVEKAKHAKTAADLGSILQELMSQYGHTLDSSFMVFTYGKQKHVYIKMNSAVRKQLDRFLGYCYEQHADINDLFCLMLVDFFEELEAEGLLPDKGLKTVLVPSAVVADEASGAVDF